METCLSVHGDQSVCLSMETSLSVCLWRPVCLSVYGDQSVCLLQMAKMASRLHCVNRWCVTGTPVNRAISGRCECVTGTPVNRAISGRCECVTGTPVNRAISGRCECVTGTPVNRAISGRCECVTGTECCPPPTVVSIAYLGYISLFVVIGEEVGVLCVTYYMTIYIYI